MQPRYSLAILTHSRQELVQRMFRSLNETMARLDTETLVLDNASEDSTWRYLASVPYIKRWRSEENLGVAGGRQQLLERARGEIVIFLDSDVEIVNPKWIEQIYMALEPENVGICGPAGSLVEWDKPGYFTPAAHGQCDVVSGWCMAVKREVIQSGIKFRVDDFPMFWHEDSAFCLDTYKAGWDVVCTGNIGVSHTPGLSGDTGRGKFTADQRFHDLYCWQGLIKYEGAW
jgi:GT2 family glycosyltransferase